MQEDKKFSTKFLEHLDQTVTKEEFTKNVEELLKFLVAMQKRNDTEIQNLQETYAQVIDLLKGEHGTDLEEVKQLCTETMRKMMSEHQAKMQAMDEKMAEVINGVDGTDADEERVMEMVLAKIPPVKELEPETPEGIRDKLETLVDEERLDVSAIKGLLERLEKIEKMKSNSGQSGGTGNPRNTIQAYDLSASLDGVTATFSLPAFSKVWQVALSSNPVLRPTVDYTINGSLFTVTFTSEIDPATKLTSGQSCIVYYSE